MEFKRTNIQLTKSQHETIRRWAFERNISMSEWIREAVDAKIRRDSAVVKWQDLSLFDTDNREVTDEQEVIEALREFKDSGSIDGVFFHRLHLPHEDEDDASTWGPKSPDHVDWTGFPAVELTWQVIEDNGGGLHLVVFEGDGVIFYGDGYEHNKGGIRADLEALRGGDDTRGWEMQVDDAQAAYAALTSHEHGWEVVADQDGVYYDRMGAAALRAFNGYQAYIGADLMGEGGTEEEAIEAAVAEYERMIGYGDHPQFSDRDALIEAIEVSIKEDE